MARLFERTGGSNKPEGRKTDISRLLANASKDSEDDGLTVQQKPPPLPDQARWNQIIMDAQSTSAAKTEIPPAPKPDFTQIRPGLEPRLVDAEPQATPAKAPDTAAPTPPPPSAVEKPQQSPERRELPQEAQWGTRTWNAIKAQWRNWWVQFELDTLDQQKQNVANELAVAQFARDASAKRIQELERESRAEKFELKLQRQNTLNGSGWTKLFGTPERTFRKAQKKYSYAQESRDAELRKLRARLAETEKQTISLEEQYATLERESQGKAKTYLKELNDKAAPLDSSWDTLTTRSKDLQEKMLTFKKQRDVAQNRMEQIMQIVRTQDLSTEQEIQLDTELERMQRLLHISEEKLKMAEKGSLDAKRKMEQLSKARDPFERFRRATNAVVEGKSARTGAEQAPRSEKEGPDFLPQLDSILIGNLADLIGKQPISLKEYLDLWNQEFPEIRLPIPEDNGSTIENIEEIEDVLLRLADESDSEASTEFIRILKEEGGNDEKNMYRRFAAIRLEALQRLDI